MCEHKLVTSMGELTIRQAGLDDAAQLRDLRLQALQDTPQAFGADFKTASERTVEWWEEEIRSGMENEERVIFLAQAGENLVGMTGIYRRNAPKSLHSGMIWGVFVQPSWRGLHLADAMIESCLGWGMARGVRIARIGVITTNTAAIRCYMRCGFEVYGVEPMAIYWGGRYYDELLMARRLDPPLKPV